MLIISRRRGESIEIANNILVKTQDVFGNEPNALVNIDIAMPGRPINRVKKVRVGETINITPDISIKITRNSGKQVGLAIDAPKDVPIWRTELLPIIH